MINSVAIFTAISYDSENLESVENGTSSYWTENLKVRFWRNDSLILFNFKGQTDSVQ